MHAFSARSSVRRRQPLSLTRGSWISLFAMLMIFIGPLISQSMPMNQRASMSMSMSMNMSMDMSMDGHSEHAQKQAAEHHALWENAAIAACCSTARRLRAGSPSRRSIRLTPRPSPHLPPAWAIPGKPSSPALEPAPRLSLRKHAPDLTRSEDSQRLDTGRLRI